MNFNMVFMQTLKDIVFTCSKRVASRQAKIKDPYETHSDSAKLTQNKTMKTENC